MDLEPSYNVILIPESREKNLGSFLGRYSMEIDQKCFAEPVLSKAEGLNMTALLACAFRLLDKTKVKAEPKQDKMEDRAPSTNFGCHDKISAQQRHRNIGEVQIELSSRADKECASQEFAKLSAVPCEVQRR